MNLSTVPVSMEGWVWVWFLEERFCSVGEPLDVTFVEFGGFPRHFEDVLRMFEDVYKIVCILMHFNIRILEDLYKKVELAPGGRALSSLRKRLD